MAPYLHQDMAGDNYRACATDVDMALNLALTLYPLARIQRYLCGVD